MLPLFLLILISVGFVVFNFVFYLKNGVIKTKEKLFKLVKVCTVVIVPIFFIAIADIGQKNNCCTDSALFSPEHRISIYTLLIAYTIAYLLSTYRTHIFPPFVELFINSFLILGLIINIVLCIHINDTELGVLFWSFGNVPILLLLLLELSENQKLLMHFIDENKLNANTSIETCCLSILKLKPILKYPILTVILIPILISLSLLILLFGQKPDSIILAFTDTYKHGFSQLDHMCDNVQCGGHFLCSVGANGHKNVVKPIRYGERNGNKIICTRQLLVANAFEDLIQEKYPNTHKTIRRFYNKVGNSIHKHYHIFNNKFVSDFVYLLMKPLELFFLMVLYSFDRKPENRIAIQYLNKKDKHKINVISIRQRGA